MNDGKWVTRDEFLRVHYYSRRNSQGSYIIRDYGANGNQIGSIKIISIIEDIINGFVLFVEICNTENKSFI